MVDLGSGSGYFALKLSPAVGKQGRVLAVDLRKLSLFFLWTRALLGARHNVRVMLGDADDPRLPAESVDAVLICNTYHEFSDPEVILKRANQSLRAGGRLVVVDRAIRAAQGDPAAEHGHEVAPSVVEGDLRKAGFEIVSSDDHFIDRAGDDLWWLVIARKL